MQIGQQIFCMLIYKQMETFWSSIISILKAAIITCISVAFKDHGCDCTEQNGKPTDLADHKVKSMTGKRNAKYCPCMVSFRSKSSEYPDEVHLQQAL